MKILIFGRGFGKGLAVYSKIKQKSFMKMIEVQAGLGIGLKKFKLIWMFENKSDLDTFINSGWKFGDQGTAAAQTRGQGGSYAAAMSIVSGVWL